MPSVSGAKAATGAPVSKKRTKKQDEKKQEKGKNQEKKKGAIGPF